MIWVNMLRHNIHRYFAEIHICAHSGGGSDSRRLKYIQNHLFGQLIGREVIHLQIVCGVNEYFVNRVGIDVFRGYILQIYTVYPRTVIDIKGHPRSSNYIIQSQIQIRFQSGSIRWGAGQGVPRSFVLPLQIDLLDPPNHFKQSGPAWYPVSFQGRGHSQTNSLLCSADVGHYQVGCQGIEAPLYALDTPIEALEVNAEVYSLFHESSPFWLLTKIAAGKPTPQRVGAVSIYSISYPSSR